MTQPTLPDSAETDALLAGCLRADRFRLRRDWQKLQEGVRGGRAVDAPLRTWQARLAASQAAREARRLSLPVPSFDDALPVCQRRDEIRALIAKHQVVIVAGETGSGKTTQLPKICLELGRGVDGYIGHTQPRRLAARAVAARLAQELGTQVGAGVGYQVRFSDQVGPASHVKLMTDGILLAEIPHDRFLDKYDTLIIDEAHERSLNIDFLLGYLKRLLPRRPDLKVIITSATIDHLRFARHFADARGNPAPVVEVSGRTYPVQTVYRPNGEDAESQVLDLPQAVHRVLEEIVADERVQGRPAAGDVLVFCTGEREIREVHQFLRKAARGIDVLPLYSRLSSAEQDKVFRPHAGRRVVLATNVAETSITVPGIRYVIDPGFVRISRYNARSRVQRLPIEPVSQASADQRKGRCGRVADGVCFRLYDETDFLSRPAYTDAEVQRTNLASVILQMAWLGLGEVEDFPFIDAPERRYVQDGWRLLEELNAVDAQHRLTPVGRQLARLPVDPRLGRMLLEAARNGSLTEVLVIVAGLAVQDPRERPHDRQQAADEAHALFADKDSDFLWFPNAWRAYEQARQDLSNADLRRWTERHFLSFLRLREWRETHHQLRLACQQLALRENEAPADFTAVHRALLSGLLSQVFMREEGRDPGDRTLTGTRNRKLQVWPGSALVKKGVQWGVAAEIIETQRTYARTVARVQPGWIEGQAQHLVRREYFDARWDGKRGMVMAREQVSLLGLLLNVGRDVHYGPLAPAVARELFIRGALVNGDWGPNPPGHAFIAHNESVSAEVERLEARLRRRDLRVDDEVLFAYFDARVPADVFSTQKFAAWYRAAAKHEPKLLCLTQQDLLARAPDDPATGAFPDSAPVAGATLTLAYRFHPGAPDDGVTLDIPAAVLHQVSPGRLDWLVPGLLRERCIALVKSLPKDLRRALVPVPDVVASVLPRLASGDRPLVEVLAAELRRVSGQDIRPAHFNLDAVPAHLRANVRVTGEDGAVLAEGRDLVALRATVGAAATRAVRAEDSLERHGIREPDFDPLPEMVERRQGELLLRLYPALVDETDNCAILVFPDEQTARAEHRRGLRRLFLLASAAVLKPMRRALSGFNEAAVRYRALGTADELLEDLWLAVADLTFLREGDEIRDAEAFRRRYEARRADLHANANRLVKVVGDALARWQDIRLRLERLPATFAASRSDIEAQLASLFSAHFVAEAPVEWLLEFPRYLQAVQARLEKLPGQPERDRALAGELRALWRDYEALDEALAAEGRRSGELVSLRWMIEEYRVSLFAQTLRTKVAVSAQRLARQRERILSGGLA
ncbi:MAG: ATP-dependent RNA helicase HrpA [Gammaproteobacteria bacterium]